VAPRIIALISWWQRGHSRLSALSVSLRAALDPQCEQNFAPWNINPKQEGQETVARRAPQCSHCGDSDEAGAPHIGQFKV
jgi:hypothetical protein